MGVGLCCTIVTALRQAVTSSEICRWSQARGDAPAAAGPSRACGGRSPGPARCASRITLRIRTVAGVTSTHSSSRQNSSACSRRQLPVRDQRHQDVAGGLAHVGELLLLGRVDVHVVRRGSSRRRSCPRRPRCPGRRTSCRAPAGWPARSRSSAPRRSATSEPVGRVRSSPCHGSYRSWTWCSRPVPRVSVRNSVRKPIRPRAGTMYSIRIQPVPWSTICSSRPLRSAMQLDEHALVVRRARRWSGAPSARAACRRRSG